MSAATLVATPPASVMPTVAIKRDNGEIVERPVCQATSKHLSSARPWRTFRWYYGQKHYSGSYWSMTEGAHVIYESRLELARLLLADYAPDVRHIIAQPFLMRARVDGRLCRHVPDYLLFTSSGLTVVAVKPEHFLQAPKIVATFAWVRHVVQDAGWTFEVFSEPDPTLLANVRFFAGYRRPESISQRLLIALRSRILVGLTFGDAVRCLDAPAPCVRAALLHMLWRHELTVDMSQPLSTHTVLKGALA
ncbi:tnsA endonuclease N terminal domain-containing protein [Mycobacterium avium subsp. hominissuis 10-5606]|nr:tnsA endonuclease N terminal domain-containing protein [Mycobacterium avium subsp. hominissuis 10-5606]